MMANGDKPAYRVFTVDENEERDDAFWTQIGAAFPHSDKKGMNIVLRALPLDGRLVLRRHTDKKAVEDKKEAAT